MLPPPIEVSERNWLLLALKLNVSVMARGMAPCTTTPLIATSCAAKEVTLAMEG
jgi:hypothetical protein